MDEDGRHDLGGHRRIYSGVGHAPVVAYVMTRGGHFIPNRQQAGSFMLGKGNHSIDTMSEFTRLVETTWAWPVRRAGIKAGGGPPD